MSLLGGCRELALVLADAQVAYSVGTFPSLVLRDCGTEVIPGTGRLLLRSVGTRVSPSSWTPCSWRFCFISWPLHGVGGNRLRPASGHLRACGQGIPFPGCPCRALGRVTRDGSMATVRFCAASGAALPLCGGEGGKVVWQPLVTSWDEGSRLPAAPGSYCLARLGSWYPLRVACGHTVLAACPLPPPLEGVVLAAGPQVPRGVASHGLGGSQEALLGRNAVACSDRLFSSSLSPWAVALPTAVYR